MLACPTCSLKMLAPLLSSHQQIGRCVAPGSGGDEAERARAVKEAVTPHTARRVRDDAESYEEYTREYDRERKRKKLEKWHEYYHEGGGKEKKHEHYMENRGDILEKQHEYYHEGGGKEKKHEYYMEKKHDLAHHWKCSLVEEPPRAAVAIGIIRSLAFSSGTAPLLFLTEKYVERAGPAETDIAVQLLECRTSAGVLDRHEEALWWVRAYSTELEEGGYSPTPSDRTYAGRIVAAVCGADRPLRKQAAAMLVGCATGTSDRVVAVTASVGAVAAVKMLERAGFVGKDERRAARTAKKRKRMHRDLADDSDECSSNEDEMVDDGSEEEEVVD